MSGDLKRLRDAADRLRLQAHHPGTGPLTRAILTGVADWLESTAKRAGYTERGIDLEHAHRVADAALGGVRQAPASGAVVFADEDGAVHFLSGDRVECGAPGGYRATCLASVTCRDCRDAFHASVTGIGAAR